MKRLGIALVVAGSTTLLGCPNPNTYGTPRTTPSGKVAHTLALEGMHIQGDTTTGSGRRESQSYTFPMLPTYQLRVGLHDRVDLGFRVANLSSLGLDVKINFLKTTSFDMAFDPGAQAFYIASTSGSFGVFYGHLPILLGLNLSENVTLVASPGVVLAAATASSNSGGSDSITSAGGVLGRFGLGLNARTSKKFAIHPEVTAMKQFNDIGGVIIVFGFGLNFGAQPSYAPGSEEDKYEADPEDRPPPMMTPAPAAAPATTPAPAPAPAGQATPI